MQCGTPTARNDGMAGKREGIEFTVPERWNVRS